MHIIRLQLKACSGDPSPLPSLKRARPVLVALGKCCLGLALAGESQWPSFFPQDLKPGNLAVNEDCELKVSLGGESDQDGGGAPSVTLLAFLTFIPGKGTDLRHLRLSS